MTNGQSQQAVTVSDGSKKGQDVGAIQAHADVKHYSLKKGEVISLPDNVEKKVKAIADSYNKKTKKDIVVTSGNRTASEQASVMFEKLKEGDDLHVYLDKTAMKEVKKAYDDGKKDKKKQIADMTSVIEAQIKKGTYISNHLRSGAVDIQNYNMSEQEKKDFKAAAGDNGITPTEEDKPPHFHLEVK